MKKIRSYTSIWSVEKVLYSINDFKLPLPITFTLELFQNLGFPVLLGTSRKSMIGLALDLPVDQRVEGTLATRCIYGRE